MMSGSHDNLCANCGKYCEEIDLVDSPEYQMSVCEECATEVIDQIKKEAKKC